MRRIRRPGEAADARMTAIVDGLGLRDPEDIDIVLIAANEGVFSIARPLENEEGHLLRAGGVALATVAASTLATPHWRWVLGHELSHKLFDRTTDDFARCTSAMMLAHPGAEARANDGAACLLMPARMFEPRWRSAPPTLAHVLAMARVFALPAAAIALRGLLFTEAACAVVCSKGGAVLWSAASVSRFGVKLAKGSPMPDARELSAAGVIEESAPCVEGGGVLSWWRKA